MTELWLKFKDENGEEQRILVDEEKFTIGRHSNNNLSVASGKLSREHVKIDRYGDIFVISDSGSSNGTRLNGEDLKDPIALKHQDLLDLGGGVDVEVEFVSDDPSIVQSQSRGAKEEDSEDEPEEDAAGATAGAGGATDHSSAAGSTSGDSGIPTSIFYIAPILGIIILAFIGIIIYAFSGNNKPEPGNDDDFVYTKNKVKSDDPDLPVNKKGSEPDPDNTKTDKTHVDTPANSGTSTTDNTSTTQTTTQNTSDTGKSEQNGAAFLRRIAQNEPKAFLTGEQAQVVSEKIKQLSGSSAIADNINSARRSSAQIKALATQKNLKPQFLATAALAKLGNSKGDALQTAQGMADTLDKLGTQIGNELANDCLLMIAAYDQGAGGDFMKMRNMLQDLATKSPESARAIRTIWFLHKNGKITDGEFDFAIRFLAIGTISQNPKDFGVNTDALNL